MPTFGFEFEVATAAPELVSRLYEIGLVGRQVMCPWHCDCGYCTHEEGEYPFHAQTDSSVSGEVISGVMDYDSQFTINPVEFMRQLQDAAVEVDAEPGLNAGMHVHVGRGRMTDVQLGKLVWAHLLWEPTLLNIAGGRWPHIRDANRTVRRDNSRFVRGYTNRIEDIRDAITHVQGEHAPYRDDFFQSLYFNHHSNDRHTNLNLRTNHPTVEFRLWNSTRSAWRMELWTRLSIALMDRNVVEEMIDPARRQYGPTNLKALLERMNHGRAATLLDRQIDYLANHAASAPTALTV